MEIINKADIIVEGCVVDVITVSPFDFEYFMKIQKLYNHPIDIQFNEKDMLENLTDDWEYHTVSDVCDIVIRELEDNNKYADVITYKFEEDLKNAMKKAVKELECGFITGTDIEEASYE